MTLADNQIKSDGRTSITASNFYWQQCYHQVANVSELTSPAQGHKQRGTPIGSDPPKLNIPAYNLPLSVLGIVLLSKFAAVFPDFKGLSLAANAAADLRTLMPTIASVGTRGNNAVSDWLMKVWSGKRHF